MPDDREILEAFLRKPPPSPAWLGIEEAGVPEERDGLLSVHGAEVLCEEGRFAATWTLDGSWDRLTVRVEVRPPLEEEDHIAPAVRIVDAALRCSAACAWLLDDADRVIARASVCFRHLGLSPRLVQNVTEEVIMDARTYGAVIDAVLACEQSLEDALEALPHLR